MKFEPQFRLSFPQTVGETDKHFDLSNYTEWLESLAEEKFTSHNTQSKPCPTCISVMDQWWFCEQCGSRFPIE